MLSAWSWLMQRYCGLFDTTSLFSPQEAFSDLALFFYDKHGGEVIAVLWKPSSFQPQPFKVSSMKGRTVTTLNNELVCVPNIEAILEDFEVLGEGLVKRVEARTEKWTV
uniref:Nucleolar protein 6 n=1 Tax=Pavo cristatus TaxID=9049 RepID=A0A8C9FN28_PAVCR